VKSNKSDRSGVREAKCGDLILDGLELVLEPGTLRLGSFRKGSHNQYSANCYDDWHYLANGTGCFIIQFLDFTNYTLI
jgi:hypothetical protein